MRTRPQSACLPRYMKFPIYCHPNLEIDIVHSSSQAESLPNIADKEASIYLNRGKGEKDEDAASEGNKRDKGSQEFIDISEVDLFDLLSLLNLTLQEDDEELSPLPKSHAGEGKARSRKGEGRRLNRQTSTEESLSHSRWNMIG